MNELKKFVGKEVKIYPGDTRKKRGILLEINEYGFVFEITFSQCASYIVGKRRFISFNSNLKFEEV
jgi:hypothetical protein